MTSKHKLARKGIIEYIDKDGHVSILDLDTGERFGTLFQNNKPGGFSVGEEVFFTIVKNVHDYLIDQIWRN